MPTSQMDIGTFVWAKMTGYPYWPGIVSDPSEQSLEESGKLGQYCIFFYGTSNFGWIDEDKVKEYFENKDSLSKANKTASFKKAIREIEEVISEDKRCMVDDAYEELEGQLKSSGIKDKVESLSLSDLNKAIFDITKKKYNKGQLPFIIAAGITKKLLEEKGIVDQSPNKSIQTPKKLDTSKKEKPASAKQKEKPPRSSSRPSRLDKSETEKKSETSITKSSPRPSTSTPLKRKIKPVVRLVSESESDEDASSSSEEVNTPKSVTSGRAKAIKTSTPKEKESIVSEDGSTDNESELEDIDWNSINIYEVIRGDEALFSKLRDLDLELSDDEKSPEETNGEPPKKKLATGHSSDDSSSSGEEEEAAGNLSFSSKIKKLSFTSRPESPVLNVEEVCQTLTEKNIKPSPLSFGFIGLGRMGSGILKNLINSKHKVTIWNRSPEKCEKFEKVGAEVALTPSDVVSAADITFCCVSDQKAAHSLFFGNCGVLSELGSGKGYVEMTSMTPSDSCDIAEAVNKVNGRFLEVRFTGGRKHAEEGTLTLLAAGDKSLFDDCSSCLQAFGKTQKWLGPEVGRASVVYLTLHAIEASVIGSLCEMIQNADSYGLNLEELCTYCEERGLFTPFIKEKFESILKCNFAPQHSLKNLQEDVEMFIDLANSRNEPSLVPAAALEFVKKSIQLGLQDHDTTSMIFGAF